MSRKYLNDKWCVRCGRKEATPYLRKNTKLFPENGKVLDIGCGNGRNSKYMAELGYDVDSVDMVNDFGIKCVLGEDPLPNKKYDIILANYVLMFLDENTRFKVMREMNSRAKENSMLMMEMYPAKDAHTYNFDSMVDYFLNEGWSKIRKLKDRCILKRG
jgi:SAM-dependent methyltransferase